MPGMCAIDVEDIDTRLLICGHMCLHHHITMEFNLPNIPLVKQI